jgi:hypothetical protein
MKKLFSIAAYTLVLLVAAFVAFGIYVSSEAEEYQVRLGKPLESDLGFAHGSPYIRIDGARQEVFTLHPTPGGTLAAAGVRDGDIPLDFGITGFYKHLYRNRGAEVTIRVVDGGDGPPVNQRAVRAIVFRVPPAR